jgi:hypothetical protein
VPFVKRCKGDFESADSCFAKTSTERMLKKFSLRCLKSIKSTALFSAYNSRSAEAEQPVTNGEAAVEVSPFLRD